MRSEAVATHQARQVDARAAAHRQVLPDGQPRIVQIDRTALLAKLYGELVSVVHLPSADDTASSASGDPYVLRLAVGDRIRFGRRADLAGQRIINGTCATVESVEPEDRDHASITARIGRRRISFSTSAIADENGHTRLAHDYATTVYQSQGLTAESCTAVIDPRYDRNSLYVAASRARGPLPSHDWFTAPVSHQKRPYRNATNAIKRGRKCNQINEPD
jgi:ATP-dependent exoDNAse (exonuclease V) alpha subunit